MKLYTVETLADGTFAVLSVVAVCARREDADVVAGLMNEKHGNVEIERTRQQMSQAAGNLAAATVALPRYSADQLGFTSGPRTR